jgi:hypothetical protein
VDRERTCGIGYSDDTVNQHVQLKRLILSDDLAFVGDLFWTAVLFGGAWLVQHGPALARRGRDLIRKPVPIPDQVRDRLFRDHALANPFLNPHP